MRQVTFSRDFDSWRTAARGLLADRVPPEQVLWTEPCLDTPALPGLAPDLPPQTATPEFPRAGPVAVPAGFLALARTVACHRDPRRWGLLYRALWRITRGERNLLEVAVDDDVHQLAVLEKAVRRDKHKMTAFVRFREVVTGEAPGSTHYVAWYRPDHYIVRAAAPFFARRFAALRWSILTPDDCAHWDGSALSFTPGQPAAAAPDADDLEDLWRAYYASTFNPARVNERAMKKELPVRFWDVLPEAQDIPDLLRDAPRRVRLMVRHAPPEDPGAAAFLPADRSLASLRDAICNCQGCPLHGPATRAVFGEGPANAEAMLVGEQPGDQEDLAGRPFVGPAGRLLDESLAAAGIDRRSLYVTNAVKHFKFEPRGGRRIHAKPSAREVAACTPWLSAEIAAVRPRHILCLGVTAAQALLGREFRMTRDRGQVYAGTPHAPWLMATFHPSALLRIPDAGRRREATAQFLADLHQFREAVERAS